MNDINWIRITKLINSLPSDKLTHIPRDHTTYAHYTAEDRLKHFKSCAFLDCVDCQSIATQTKELEHEIIELRAEEEIELKVHILDAVENERLMDIWIEEIKKEQECK